MNSLAEVVMNHHDEITKYLYIGYAQWDCLISCVERQERKPSDDFDDEQIWTFLVLLCYFYGQHMVVPGRACPVVGGSLRSDLSRPARR